MNIKVIIINTLIISIKAFYDKNIKIITGQNPQSPIGVAKKVWNAIQ